MASRLPRASHWATAAFTLAAAVPWAPTPTASHMEGGRRIRNMVRKRSLSGELLEKMLLELPHENTGLEALHFHGEMK